MAGLYAEPPNSASAGRDALQALSSAQKSASAPVSGPQM
eukprot:gene2108-12083_t